MKGVFLDTLSLKPDELDLSALRNTLDDWQFLDNCAANDIDRAIKNAEVVVSNKVLLDRDTLSRANKLELICVAATGTNNVDLQAADELGIAVCNVRGYATASVVQHAFALILALQTRLLDYQRSMQQGAWQQSPFFCLLDHPISELAGKTMGIIGYGELGSAVAKLAHAFGMQVLIAEGRSDTPPRTALKTLLAQADVISLHCPLSKTTRNLIGTEEFKLMKPTALLINTARGGIVDEAALIQALKNGDIGGAGFDVLSKEPPTDDHPLLSEALPNFILTPHIAWASRESRQRLVNQLVENISGFCAGEPRNLLTGSRTGR